MDRSGTILNWTTPGRGSWIDPQRWDITWFSSRSGKSRAIDNLRGRSLNGKRTNLAVSKSNYRRRRVMINYVRAGVVA